MLCPCQAKIDSNIYRYKISAFRCFVILYHYLSLYYLYFRICSSHPRYSLYFHILRHYQNLRCNTFCHTALHRHKLFCHCIAILAYNISNHHNSVCVLRNNLVCYRSISTLIRCAICKTYLCFIIIDCAARRC